MKIWKILKKLIVVSTVSVAFCFAGDYVVIVNPENSLSALSKSELKRLYTGKVSDIDGKKAVPINLSYELATAESFLSEVVEKDGAKYTKFWVDEMIKGNGTAPMIKPNATAVKAMVSQIPGAVGYIPAADVDATVKKIDIN